MSDASGRADLRKCCGIASVSRYRRVFAALLACLTIWMLAAPFMPAAHAAGGRQKNSLVIGFDGKPDVHGIPSPWRVRIRHGSAGVALASHGGETTLRLSCSNASFGVERPVDVSLETHPTVSWAWLALSLPEAGDVREKRRNDQALQLLFLFEGGRIISYVWDSNAPEGTIADESVGWPLNLRVKVLVLQSGREGIGSWHTVKRNIYADYRAHFREEPPRLVGLRVQTNTQYTAGNAEGLIKEIVFSGS